MNAPQPSAAQERDATFLRDNAHLMTTAELERYGWLAGEVPPVSQRAARQPQRGLFDPACVEAA